MARHQFTPAATRALVAAAKWTNGDGSAALSPTGLLLGLLEESESRAAEMLLARGIDTPTVLNRWPGNVQSPKSEVQSHEGRNHRDPAVLSPELQNALAEASLRLADFPRPLELATEHLLLGLVTAGDELASWLGEHGFDPDALAGEICRLYGYGEGSGFRVQGSGEGAQYTGSVGNTLCGVPETVEVEPIASLRNATEGVPYRTSAPQDVPPPMDTVSVGAPRSATECVHSGTSTDGLSRVALFRLLDAAANRAREGLRVLEDYVRFVWDDRHLTSQLKQLRHDLASSLARLPADELLASRDTLADVGTTVSTAGERRRPDMVSVVTANAKRLQESLRSIEEYGKIVSPEAAAEIEQLRYRSYTLERALAATSLGLRRLAEARLYVLIDGRSKVPAFRELVQTLVAAGVDVVQLRDKQLADGELLKRARLLRELTSATNTLFIMNDRPDLAVLSQADGVHVGQEELSVAACRQIVGPRALVGVSTHSLEQARQAVLDGANYIGVGPTFPSQTKPFASHALRGPELLRAVKSEIHLPAFAIGGIDCQNLDEVLKAGVVRVAVSGAILSADDPGQTARQLATRLAGAPASLFYTSHNT
ncbi:MAG TPA: thiamine phosphate synthase [Pirellulales bacterium]|nr:thiamine phosphate synthase [Pirellulales bacterium]